MSTQVWCKPFKQAITPLLNNPVNIKPDNILVNNGSAPDRFSDVQLGDCGDAFMVDPKASPFEEGHVIGAAIFHSPKAMLNLRWRAPTDIWSFGATVSDQSHCFEIPLS
jgi:hypothetical protein